MNIPPMMGMSVSVRIWFTRYWYPSLTYLSLTELEKSGKIGGMFATTREIKNPRERKREAERTSYGGKVVWLGNIWWWERKRGR